jgi:inosine/xanthosine triphosphatase
LIKKKIKQAMKTIVIASTNPVKIEAVLNGFKRFFPFEYFKVQGVTVISGVSEQPMTDRECQKGAGNRADNAKLMTPEADYWVGVEGGCDYLGSDLVAFAWIVILDRTVRGYARTATFCLPKKVQNLVESGLELGAADDLVFGEINSKQNSGAVGLLTGDVVTRTTLYEQAVILALIPFKNIGLYKN